jgi:hypothetical protein
MIKLSNEPQRLTSTFLSYRNDIDIYTEDNEKDKEFYKVLFGRLLKNDIIINDITPLGSKSEVITRCENEPKNGRKKLFIVDGDVLIIHGENIPEMNNLFVLDAYCIENFLFDKETIIHFIYLSCATKSKDKIELELEYENWLKDYSNNFVELFINFAIANYFGCHFTLFNARKYHVKNQDKYAFSPELVNQDILNLKKEIIEKTSEEEYNQKYLELKSQWTCCSTSLATIVSGKDYLIPILLLKTAEFKKSKALPTLEEIKFSLAQYSNLERLFRLKTKIESL